MLNNQTLLIVVSILALISAIVLLLAWRTEKQLWLILVYWCVSWLFLGTGTTLIALRGSIPDWLSIIAANVLILSSFALLQEGIAHFSGVPGRGRILNAIILFIYAILQTYWTLIAPNLLYRFIIIDLAAILLMSIPVYTLTRYLSPAFGRVRIFMIAVLVGYAAWQIVGIWASSGVNPAANFLHLEVANAVILALLMFQFSITLSCFWMLAQKQTIRFLEQARQDALRLVAIIEATSDFVTTADTEGRILYYNKAARRMTGIAEHEEVTSLRVSDKRPEWASRVILEEAIPAAIRDGIWQGETALLNGAGQEISVSQVLIAHQGPDGKVAYLSTIDRDITESKMAEERIRRLNEDLSSRAEELAYANQELESFNYTVAHDLRAPLRGINGFSQMIIGKFYDKLDDDGREYLEIIRFECIRMNKLISDLLDLSRLSLKKISREEVDLSEMAESIAAELKKREPERQVDFIITPSVNADGDKLLLLSVLQNLLENAWKFTSNHERARIEFGVTQHEGKKVYFVRDDGAGFDMRYTDKLFGIFQRLHGVGEFPGNGIGLAIIQRIIRHHGGQVWGEGTVERGATFYFTLN